jgi:hypothetical protein
MDISAPCRDGGLCLSFGERGHIRRALRLSIRVVGVHCERNVARGGKLRVLQAASWLGELRCAQTTLEKTPLCMNRPPLLPPTTLPKAQPFNGLHGFVHILATLPACVNSDLCAHTVIFEGPKLSIEPHMMA